MGNVNAAKPAIIDHPVTLVARFKRASRRAACCNCLRSAEFTLKPRSYLFVMVLQCHLNNFMALCTAFMG
jgi:hypothetical protein